MGDKFYLPACFNKKHFIYEHIKDLESIGYKHTDNPHIPVRNAVLSLLKDFISHKDLLTTFESKIKNLLDQTTHFNKNP